MKKIASYTILDDINIVTEYYNGGITIEDIIELKKRLFSEKLYNPKIQIIMDFRTANLLIKEPELILYTEFAKNKLNAISERKVAFLTNTPNEVVIGTLFEFVKKNLPMTTDVFSTLKAAALWLNLSYEEMVKVENTFNEFLK
ncbi:hypothetical protein MHL31_08565 [Lutibacter sp. A80]|uniref:hypothetical protein n=1 Tax=Lutibacter sp. A80 TaxID=2918453 RepID=UPI001F057737|nr:hypothetical protein [Lutibacter sp. A80]UMB59134.1 hypothetical protein MHL31_08565 [Lutibacter sp. A80]